MRDTVQAVEAETRKVGATIPTEQHAQLKLLASKHGTTVENLIKLGIANLPSLLGHPSNVRKLERDRRLSR